MRNRRVSHGANTGLAAPHHEAREVAGARGFRARYSSPR